MTIDIPDTLIALETTAWEEIRSGQLTVKTAAAVHEGVVAFAEASGEERLAVEESLKRIVRHPEPEAG
ncbi:hypothetical protein AB0I27_22325 [Streptomyces sp. NPDC050597]|uniref:hypothetical protein n=1 Tax=Streptomyces sp. NPDC050597 TaxID=3157212 RepID=UPI00342FCADB